MFPRRRIDNLSDGIFGVAMTLLVLEIRIPDGVEPRSDADLTALLASLLPKIGPYALSFAVLGIRWRELVADRASGAEVGKAYVNWMLANLLLVTFVPFSTLILGRYALLAPAVWLYAGNLTGMAVCGWLAERSARAPGESGAVQTAGLAVYLLAAAVTAGLGFLHTPWAPMGFLLNALAPPLERWIAARQGRGATAPTRAD